MSAAPAMAARAAMDTFSGRRDIENHPVEKNVR
jgi:hypothetical protein